MRTKLFLAIGTLALASCASSQATREPTTPAPAPQERAGMQGEMMMDGQQNMCPMQVAGTSVSAEDVEGGVALRFTTTGDVAELRRRVAHMAQMHSHHGEQRGHGMGMHGSGTGGPGHGHGARAGQGGLQGGGMMDGGMRMPAATARSEEIDGGARVVLTPTDPTDLDAVREHARQMAERMSSGHCPMMNGGEHSGEPPSDAGHETHHPDAKPGGTP